MHEIRRGVVASAALAGCVAGLAVPASAATAPGTTTNGMVEMYGALRRAAAAGAPVSLAEPTLSPAYLQLQDDVSGIVSALHQRLAAGYAGVWMEPPTARLKVGIAPSTDRAAASAVLREFGIANRSDLVPVASTWNQLVAAQGSWSARVADLILRQEASVGIVPSKNAVVVDVSDAVPATRLADARSQARGESVSALIESSPAASFDVTAHGAGLFSTPASTTTGCSYPYCDRPLRGAVRINGPGGVWCSSGFITRSNSDNKPYVLTAGHCLKGNIGSNWSTKGATYGHTHVIGPAHKYFADPSGDVGLISISDPYFAHDKHFVPAIAAWWVDYRYNVASVQHGYEGEAVCRFGGRSAASCGKIIKVHTTLAVRNGNTPMIRTWMVGTSACGRPGDSGGPFMNGHTGLGIDNSGRFDTCPNPYPTHIDEWYADLPDMARRVHVHVLTRQ